MDPSQQPQQTFSVAVDDDISTEFEQMIAAAAAKHGISVADYKARISASSSSAAVAAASATSPRQPRQQLAQEDPAVPNQNQNQNQNHANLEMDQATQNAAQASVDKGCKPNVLDIFVTTMDKLLRNIARTFPECPAVPAFQRKLELAKKIGATQKVIAKWHDEMHTYYDSIERRDESKLREMQNTSGTFRDLNILAKYDDPGFSPQHKAALFKYLKKLNSCARMHNDIPTDMMSRITDVASDLQAKIARGETSLSQLNLQEIGMQVMGGLSEETQGSFAQSIPSLFKALNSMGDLNPQAMASAISGQNVSPEQLFAE